MHEVLAEIVWLYVQLMVEEKEELGHRNANAWGLATRYSMKSHMSQAAEERTSNNGPFGENPFLSRTGQSSRDR